MAEHESSMFREELLKLARCWAGYEPVPGKAPYSEDSCRPVGSGKKKKKKEEESKGEKKAGTPAWQRSEGKNDEGGLNEKGRKSYEREHGGNLKAPVTQKNPKGEAKKRQNSFCSRMCGMKRVNTGAKTKSDPDSRINKSLRKWNCKCSSAEEFGQKCANVGLGLRAAAGVARALPKLTAGETALMNSLRALGRGFSMPAGRASIPTWLRAAQEGATNLARAGKGPWENIQKLLSGSWKEMDVRRIAAERLASGSLKVPPVSLLPK